MKPFLLLILLSSLSCAAQDTASYKQFVLKPGTIFKSEVFYSEKIRDVQITATKTTDISSGTSMKSLSMVSASNSLFQVKSLGTGGLTLEWLDLPGIIRTLQYYETQTAEKKSGDISFYYVSPNGTTLTCSNIGGWSIILGTSTDTITGISAIVLKPKDLPDIIQALSGLVH